MSAAAASLLLLAGAPIGVSAADGADAEEDPAFRGELQILDDFQDPDERTGHVSMGGLSRGADNYFDWKSGVGERGLTWLVEIAPQYQDHLDGGAGSTANNETNLILRWSAIDPSDADRGNLLVWYQISSTWGSNTTSAFQTGLGVLSPPNGGDTAPLDTRDLAQHIAWEQRLFDDRFRYQVGKLTTRVLMNLNRYAVSDREDFFTPMLVNNPVTHYTARIGFGFFGEYSRDAWYVSGMIRDADADLSERFIDFSSLSTGNWEYLVEVGLTPEDVAGLGEGIYRLTVSSSDATATAPSTGSWSLSFDQDLGEDLGAYLRYASSDDTFRAFERRSAIGLQWLAPFGFVNDRVGVGLWWGTPSDPTLRSEQGLDLFYRVQIERFMEISAGAQLIFDPALRTDKDHVSMAQLRLRLLF